MPEAAYVMPPRDFSDSFGGFLDTDPHFGKWGNATFRISQ